MKKPSLLPDGVTLTGAIEGDADLVIRGRVEGPVRVGGSLLIDESGVVRGHVHARSLTVRGVLKGNAFGDEIVRIEASARVVGDLTAPRVRVVRGARFRGQVHMGEVGEPVLAAYDARMHTFTGVPAPDPEPATRELMARARQASGPPTPSTRAEGSESSRSRLRASPSRHLPAIGRASAQRRSS